MPRQGGRDRHQLLLLLLPFLLLRQGGKDRLEDHSIWTLPNPLESESGDEAMLSNQIVTKSWDIFYSIGIREPRVFVHRYQSGTQISAIDSGSRTRPFQFQ